MPSVVNYNAQGKCKHYSTGIYTADGYTIRYQLVKDVLDRVSLSEINERVMEKAAKDLTARTCKLFLNNTLLEINP